MERKIEQGHSRPEGFAKLPSQFQPSDKIGLQMLIDIMEDARDGQVTKVSFLQGKVRYDIQIPIYSDDDLEPGQDPITREPRGYFRIANVDSAFIGVPFNNGFHYNSKRDRQSRHDVTKEPVILDGLSAHPSKEVPKQDPTEEDLSYYVLIDVNGYRKQSDFEIGYYNFSSKKWNLKHGDSKDIDLDHMRWTYLPNVELDK